MVSFTISLIPLKPPLPYKYTKKALMTKTHLYIITAAPQFVNKHKFILDIIAYKSNKLIWLDWDSPKRHLFSSSFCMTVLESFALVFKSSTDKNS